MPWERAIACSDRRLHLRFGPETVQAFAWLQPLPGESESRDAAKVVNLSSGGICFQTRAGRLRAGSSCGLRLELGTPLERDVLTVVQIRWIRRLPGLSGVMAGAEFIASTCGWFGPEDETLQ